MALGHFSHMDTASPCLSTFGLATNSHHPANNRWAEVKSHAGGNGKTGIFFSLLLSIGIILSL
jgi:hypothetical protein